MEPSLHAILPIAGLASFGLGAITLFIIFMALSVALKGWALWIAARNKHKVWFILLLFINTAGILELIYIYLVGKPLLNETMGKDHKAEADENNAEKE